MSSTRPRLMLDERSFQGLLAAAFTIQQHNDRQRSLGSSSPAGAKESAPKPAPAELCRACGAPLPGERAPCPNCGAENFRPGERLQRNWASLWLMSQEQGLWPELREKAAPGVPPLPSEPRSDGHEPGDSRVVAPPPLAKPEPAGAKAIEDRGLSVPSIALSAKGGPALDGPALDDSALSDLSLDDPALSNPALNDPAAADAAPLADGTSPVRRGLLDLQVKLRYRRADLYLGIAVMVAALALLWPATAPRRAGLRVWEKMLISMGMAEAPAPVTVHFPGDPNVKVWVDTHTALYYCPGEELYGKSRDGHFTTQREAQLDRFEPAQRAVCE